MSDAAIVEGSGRKLCGVCAENNAVTAKGISNIGNSG